MKSVSILFPCGQPMTTKIKHLIKPFESEVLVVLLLYMMLLRILRLVTHTFSVAGILLIVMRLIWHGLNYYLPASDWHSHKKGWVGLGSRWWHSTWPNWSISMLGRRCSTGGQRHTIYFTIYRAQTHGHQSWHPEGPHAPEPRCAKVDDIRISHPLF